VETSAVVKTDIQGHGGIVNGNWRLPVINGIGQSIGRRQSQISEIAKTAPSRNVYYMLPFLLGLIGMLYQVTRRKKTIL
jgi:hypothetical protein